MAQDLSDEILAVIPTDPYDQLDLARKITAVAISTRVSHLETEMGRLRKQSDDKNRVVSDLEGKVDQLEKLVQESDAKAQAVVEENVKLSRERDYFATTAKKLSRDLNKLEKFKKHLMLSLSEENSPSLVENVDVEASNMPVPHDSLSKDDEKDGSERQSYWPTPYITPRFTPSATPSITSASVSPQGTTVRVSPKLRSSATSPTKSRIEGKIMSTPSRARTLQGSMARIDGKEFFRQARNRLSYEQFGAFLANIKELNSHGQSREETLTKAQEIFGTENKDLYLSFHGLLYRRTS